MATTTRSRPIRRFRGGRIWPIPSIRSATKNPAEFLGRDREEGTIEIGKKANLTVLDANPLEDIANTRVASAHYCDFVDLPCATIVQLPPSTDVSHLSAEDAKSFENDSVQRLLLLHPIPVHVTVAPSMPLATYVLTNRPLKPQYMYLRSPTS